MPTFVRGDVVEVPFPADAGGPSAPGPAVVVSPFDLARSHGLLWVVPIAKQDEATGWGDLAILDAHVAGVAPRSVIRTARLASVPAADAKRIGRISPPLLAAVIGQIHGALGRM